ncbi:MAG: hypothetical protein IIW39_06670 [Clostridia bacterium]|jgi:hypothetical protein|nr:hypothetical protein [Clostridia bacterium]MBQ5838340.1 hypothetical protein [Clostridia bacterium]
MKKLRPIIGISLLVQSATFFVLCLLNLEKKKSLAKAFGFFGALGGIAGVTLLISEFRRRKKLKAAEDAYLDEYDEFVSDFEDFDADEDDILCTFEGKEA